MSDIKNNETTTPINVERYITVNKVIDITLADLAVFLSFTFSAVFSGDNKLKIVLRITSNNSTTDTIRAPP
jgi:hypothetical protein